MNSSTGEFLISKEELTRQDAQLRPLDPKHRPAGPCQECMYRKERQGACPNCGRPKNQGKRRL